MFDILTQLCSSFQFGHFHTLKQTLPKSFFSFCGVAVFVYIVIFKKNKCVEKKQKEEAKSTKKAAKQTEDMVR